MNEQIKTVKYEFGGNTVFITLIHDFFVVTSDMLDGNILSCVYLANQRARMNDDGTFYGMLINSHCTKYFHAYIKNQEQDIEALHGITVKELIDNVYKKKGDVKWWNLGLVIPDEQIQLRAIFKEIVAFLKPTVIDLMEDEHND